MRALVEGGVILVTLDTGDMEMDIGDFGRSTMAWSSYPVEENQEMVKGAGFKLMLVEEENDKESKHHLWILARKN